MLTLKGRFCTALPFCTDLTQDVLLPIAAGRGWLVHPDKGLRDAGGESRRKRGADKAALPRVSWEVVKRGNRRGLELASCLNGGF